MVRAEFASASDLRRAFEQTVRTQSLLSEAKELHLDAETGVRGYVITGDEAFLAPYRSAVARREILLSELQTQAEGRSTASLSRLEQLSDQQLALAKLNADDVLEGRAEQARARIAQGRGKQMMDSIRAEIAMLSKIEEHRLEALGRASQNTRSTIENGLAILLVAIALLLALLTLMVSRSARARQAALARTERLAARQIALFDGAVDGMLLLDDDGVIMRTNPSVERMFDLSSDFLRERHITVLMADAFTTEQSRLWLAQVGKAGTDGAGRKQEFTGKRADGSTFDTEVAISLVQEGENKQYVAVLRDISHRKRAERMKSEFVSTVSHELRTPLTSIGGSLGLLAGGAVGSLNEKAARLVAIAHSNCERLIRLINDILDIEKIESGKMTFDLRRMMIGPLVRRTMEANRQYADDHEVTLQVELPPWPQCISGDPDRLEQVLTNLISNAIKHSPSGETVTLRTDQMGSRLRIEVLDRGSGVPEDFRDRIFSKFAMADGSDVRTRGGTGLGLAIVREIAERHGGKAGFEDRPGGGSVFFVDLPLIAEPGVLSQTEQDGLPTILHIDDDLDCLSVVNSAFAGRAVLLSVDSIAAARDLLTRRDDIAGCIVDVGLGQESGLDLMPAIRSTAPQLPIILFTALDEPHREAEAEAVLIKSRTPIEALVETTLAHIGRSEGAKQ